MNEKIKKLAEVVRSAERRKFFRMRPVFELHSEASSDGLNALNQKIKMPMPDDLREWLLTIGYGDIDGEISFREEWFAAIEHGQLKGGATFAQDVLGNFYAFDVSGQIYYLSRSQSIFACMSIDFMEFVDELVRREYKLLDWVDALKTEPYDW